MGHQNQGIIRLPSFSTQQDVYRPKPSRWKGYKTQFPGSNLKPSDEDPCNSAAGHEFRCQWSEQDKKFRFQRRFNDKCQREEHVYQTVLEGRRQKLSELLAGENKYLQEARRKMEIGKTQRLSMLKEELKAVMQRRENDHRKLVEACLMRRKIPLDDEQRRQMNRTYVQDWKAQIGLKATISAEMAEEEAILSEMKSLEPWMAGRDEEHGNVFSQTRRSLSEGLRAEKMRRLEAKVRAREMRQKAYEDQIAQSERTKREEQEERDRVAARKAHLKKEYEEEIQQRRAILQDRNKNEETVKQAYVLLDQPLPDESLQKKVQKQKEVMVFLDYVRDFQTEQQKRNMEVDRLIEEEARKERAKQQEIRTVQARADKIRNEETKAALLEQMRAKEGRLACQDNQAYDPDKCFLNKLFNADDLRQKYSKALKNQYSHEKQTTDFQTFLNEHCHKISEGTETEMHSKFQDWWKMGAVAKHVLPRCDGLTPLQS